MAISHDQDSDIAPLEVPFNTTASLGPDGPWNFITLSVGYGTAVSNVSFFPQTQGTISVLTSAALCRQNSTSCPDGIEYFDGLAASTQTSPDGIQLNWQQLDSNARLGQSNWTTIQGNVSFWEENFNDPLNIDNLTVLIAQSTTANIGPQTYAPSSVLQLSAGPKNKGDADLNKTSNGKQQELNLTWPVQQSSQGGRPRSYNLHMGSAMFNQSGSLYFGGYDSSRIIEPMHRFLTESINLVDISFETAYGPSPWNSNFSDVFAQTIYLGTVAGSIFAPEHPYFTLTPSLCQAMSARLPIMYDTLTELYLWNQADPKYDEIMTSPSYIQFDFAVDDGRVAIKVPFASLNLTLGPPIKNPPVPYFPCASSDKNTLVFGRALLQSANLGHFNDGNATFQYIGQAPGPSISKNTTAQPVSFSSGNYSVPANAPTWEETWAGTWAQLSNAPNSTSGSPHPGSTNAPPSLSTGQVVGIVFGVIAVLGIAIAGLWFGIRYKRRRRSGGQANNRTKSGKLQNDPGSEMDVRTREIGASQDMDSRTQLELSAMHEPEVDGVVFYELSATSGPMELPDGMSMSSRRTSVTSYMYEYMDR